MLKTSLFIVSIFLLGLSSSGCSSSPRSDFTYDLNLKKACSLLSASQASTLMGAKVTKPDNNQHMSQAQGNVLSHCSYMPDDESSMKQIAIMALQYPKDLDPKHVFETSKDSIKKGSPEMNIPGFKIEEVKDFNLPAYWLPDMKQFYFLLGNMSITISTTQIDNSIDFSKKVALEIQKNLKG